MAKRTANASPRPKRHSWSFFVFPDIHWSDRDERVLEIAEKAHRWFHPDVTIVGGDLLNCDPFTRFARKSLDDALEEGYNFESSELRPASQFLDRIQQHTRRRTIMLEGNHDAWFERWIAANPVGRAFMDHLPRLYLSAGRKQFTYRKSVELSHSTGKRLCNFNLTPKLIVTHGWAANKHALHTHLEKVRPLSIVFCHTHRWGMIGDTLYDLKEVESVAAGCLCQNHPRYAHDGVPTAWVHGFVTGFVGRGSHTIVPVRIRQRKFCIMDGGHEIRL